MGNGAPKKVDAIPTELIVKVFAWEGLLYETSRKLADVLNDIFRGNDSPENWERLNTLRISLINYNKEYTKAILRMQFSQGEG